MTEVQLNKFNEFLLNFVRASHSRLIYPIYRGESLEMLYKKLGLEDIQENDLAHKLLLERLFMIGDKSKNYFSKEQFGLKHVFSFGINDCSKTVLNFIFDTLSDCAKKHPVESVRQFFDINISFRKYFLEKRNNKGNFIASINSLPKQKQISVRNYYLRLLHQIGSINYRDKSNIISTSRNYSVQAILRKGKVCKKE